MIEVIRELVDAVHALKAITGTRRAELHAALDQAPAEIRHIVDAPFSPASPAPAP
jgi:hypothetical protein